MVGSRQAATRQPPALIHHHVTGTALYLVATWYMSFLHHVFIFRLLSLFLPGRVTSGSSLQKQILPQRRVQVSFKEAPACPKTSQPYHPPSLPQSHILSHHPSLPDSVLVLLICRTLKAAARGFWSEKMVHVWPNESQRFQRA